MIAIYNISDIIDSSQDKKFSDIELTDLKYSNKTAQLANAVILVNKRDSILRVMKWGWYKEDYDSKLVYPLSDLNAILQDALVQSNKIGRSLKVPGTNKLRK